MKNCLLPVFALLLVGCGNQQSKTVATPSSIETEDPDTTAAVITEESDRESSQDATTEPATAKESLNDIRFANWTDEDWRDNDYFRALRKYINTYNPNDDEQVPSADLEAYRDILIKSKFAIFGASPHVGGGMDACIIFLDMPNKIFRAWIYSKVDMNTKKMRGYTVREFSLVDAEYAYTKEGILAILKDHPEHKLW